MSQFNASFVIKITDLGLILWHEGIEILRNNNLMLKTNPFIHSFDMVGAIKKQVFVQVL